jgi:monoamine oxidase
VKGSPDSVLIIGAGAAGIAAGRMLHDAGCDVLILEARDRIGGRIHTDFSFADFPVELGAEFIHGERTVTHDLVNQAGLATIPVVRMDNLWWAEAGHKAMPRQAASLDQLLSDYASLEHAHLSTDISLADYLDTRGWRDEAMADVLLAQTCCARLQDLSCYDLIREMHADHAGHDEARIREGYAPLLVRYSRDLRIRLNAPVSEIQWSQDDVTVIAGGEAFQAGKCIITVPVSILQTDAIRFDPPLSEEKRWAIHNLHVEPATKLIYRFREPLWPDHLTYMAHTGLAVRWWTPGYGRPDAAVICAYITAERARQIDRLDETAALTTGLRELGQLLGIPLATLQPQMIAARRVSWAADPYTLGGYAHVRPGGVEARPVLARPEADTLFFAGEATAYDTNPQTVHGAIESGQRAAQECI